MKHIRFYEEFADEGTREQSQGNVAAIFVGNGTYTCGEQTCYEGLGAVYFHPNSPVATSGYALSYLQENCRRVSEARAREIHPALFHRLDNNEQ